MKKIIKLFVIVILLVIMSSTAYAAKKDVKAPVVTKTKPVQNEMDIMIEDTIIICFNEPVKSGKLISKIVLKDANQLSVNYSLAIKDNRLIITPTKSLQYNMMYTITVPTTAISDLAGNSLKEKYTLTYTTEEKGGEKKDAFTWKTSTFKELPEPEALLTTFVDIPADDCSMCTFAEMNKTQAEAYMNSLFIVGFQSENIYSDKNGVIFNGFKQNGYEVHFTYSSKTMEGTLLYQYNTLLSDLIAYALNNDTNASDDEDDDSSSENIEDIDNEDEAEEMNDTDEETNPYPEITLSCDPVLYMDSMGTVTVTATLDQNGTFERIANQKINVRYITIDPETYVGKSYQLWCINKNPAQFEVTYQSHTDSTVTYKIRSLSNSGGDIKFELLSDEGPTVDVVGFHININ